MLVEAEALHDIEVDFAGSPSVQGAPQRLHAKASQIEAALVGALGFARESQFGTVDSVGEERVHADTAEVRNVLTVTDSVVSALKKLGSVNVRRVEWNLFQNISRRIIREFEVR